MPNQQKEWTTPELEAQVRVSKLLGIALALSIVGVGGIGSLGAFILGFRALRMIRRSGGMLSGRIMAWWCLIVGGAIILPPLLLMMILGELR